LAHKIAKEWNRINAKYKKKIGKENGYSIRLLENDLAPRIAWELPPLR